MNLRKGFTLVELLIVIIIIAILAAVVLVAIDPAQQRARTLLTTGRSNVAAVCRAQAVCLVERDFDECDAWGNGSVDMVDPSDGIWTFGFDTTDQRVVYAHATSGFGGVEFGLSCNNFGDDRGRTLCYNEDDATGDPYTCENLGYSERTDPVTDGLIRNWATFQSILPAP